MTLRKTFFFPRFTVWEGFQALSVKSLTIGKLINITTAYAAVSAPKKSPQTLCLKLLLNLHPKQSKYVLFFGYISVTIQSLEHNKWQANIYMHKYATQREIFQFWWDYFLMQKENKER